MEINVGGEIAIVLFGKSNEESNKALLSILHPLLVLNAPASPCRAGYIDCCQIILCEKYVFGLYCGVEFCIFTHQINVSLNTGSGPENKQILL